VIQTKSLAFAEKAVLVAPTALGLLASVTQRHIPAVGSLRRVHSQKHVHAVTPLRNLVATMLLVVTMEVGRAPVKMDPTNVETYFC